MRIVVAGATGFLGRPLVRSLVSEGHRVAILTRTAAPQSHAGAELVAWSPDGTVGAWSAAVDGADAVVNLAGESIGDHRWTDAQKQRILDSRLKATRSLVEAIVAARHPPAVFVSGSAIGYYGPLTDTAVTEQAPPGADFLAHVCVGWEAEAMRAASGGTRVVPLRTGLVIEKDGGALARMLLPFKLGVGGPLGSGEQYSSWIHRDDWVRLVEWAIGTDAVSGPLNATAPTPVTNREFSRALGRAIHRPAVLTTPAFALRLLLGEMADGLLLSGQRVVPEKALRLGFAFEYPRIDDAFRAIFRSR